MKQATATSTRRGLPVQSGLRAGNYGDCLNQCWQDTSETAWCQDVCECTNDWKRSRNNPATASQS